MDYSGKYVISLSDESFHSQLYDSKEEAIKYGREIYDDDGAFYVGRAKNVHLHIGVDEVLERLSENLYDNVGEVAENFEWDDRQFKKAEAIIEEAVSKIEKVIPPRCYLVEDIERIEIEQSKGYKLDNGISCIAGCE
jgi:hypothetical protein